MSSASLSGTRNWASGVLFLAPRSMYNEGLGLVSDRIWVALLNLSCTVKLEGAKNDRT